GGAIAAGLAHAGARVAILGRRAARAEEVAAAIREFGGEAGAAPGGVAGPGGLGNVRPGVLARFGRIGNLVNGAGGNTPAATVTESSSFFDLAPAALHDVLDLNLMGTLLPCQVFGRAMARQRSGAIVNVSSMAARRALSRVVAYSAAKAAIENLT